MRVSCHSEIAGVPSQSTFMLCDAKDAAKSALESYKGKVQLIYLDPPYLTGKQFDMRLRLGRGKGAVTVKIPTYSDKLDDRSYYSLMDEVLRICHQLLSSQGCLYLHVDYRASARLKLMLDDIFGKENFVNEIIWHYKSGGRAVKHFSRKHDNILFYRKGKKQFFDIKAVGTPRGKTARNHMKRVVDGNGKVSYTIRSGSKTYSYDEETPVYPSDVWTDISHLQQKDPERTAFDTQKPEALLKRIILSSSRKGDIVCDFFAGSGTTAAVALKNGRVFIGSDQSPVAMNILRKRICVEQPEMLGEKYGLKLEVRQDANTLDAEFSCKSKDGSVTVTLKGCSCAIAQSQELNPIDRVACWAVGTMEKDCFIPITQAFHTGKKQIENKLCVPQGDGLVVQVVNLIGETGYFTL